MDNKFDYKVTPKVPIRGVSKDIIKKNTVLPLTKEQVKFCLKHGPVYRRYDTGMEERAYTYNLDRLHYAKYISEEEWNATREESVEENPTVNSTWIAPTVEEAKVVDDRLLPPLDNDDVLKDIAEKAKSVVFEAKSIKDTVSAIESYQIEVDDSEDSSDTEEEVSTVEEDTDDNTIDSDEEEVVEEEVKEEVASTPITPTTNSYNRKRRKNRK